MEHEFVCFVVWFWPLVAFNKIILSTVLFGVFWGWLQFFCFGLLWLGCLVLLLV